MPKFSHESFSKLVTCHTDLQILFFDVIKYYDCTIIEGHRTQEQQEKDFTAGTTKLHYPFGKHDSQPSMAVDVTPCPVNFNDNNLAIWFGGFVMGIAVKLKEEGKMEHSVRWGGSWDGLGRLDTPHELHDQVHFELIT